MFDQVSQFIYNDNKGNHEYKVCAYTTVQDMEKAGCQMFLNNRYYSSLYDDYVTLHGALRALATTTDGYKTKHTHACYELCRHK